jgi:protoporphyrin/coproporphyrin ferrochelatase
MGSGPTGVILTNIGGPRTEPDVGNLIRDMLSDPMVMPLPWPLRPLLARRIARRRSGESTAHYRAVGLPSPVLSQTRAQAEALQVALGDGYVVSHSFRYSTPRARQAIAELDRKGVRRLVVLPGYPQWSRSTSGTAVKELAREANRREISVAQVPAYPTAGGFLQAHLDSIVPLLEKSAHVLFCAHGLPQRTVEAGDPYVDQVRETAAALAAALPASTPHSLAFQSRVGRMEWTRPYLTDELMRLGREETRALILVPLSFVCENIETLFELDIESAGLAEKAGIESVQRTPTPGTHPAFIQELAGLVRQSARRAGWEDSHGA